MTKRRRWTDTEINRVFPEIFERISNGETLRGVLKSDTKKFPDSMMFYEILEEHEDLSKRLARAYKAYKDFCAEEMLSIAYHTEEGVITKDTPKGPEITRGDMTQHRRLKIDTIKGVLNIITPNIGNQNAVGDRGGMRFDEEYED